MAELRAVARRSTPTHSHDTLQMMLLHRTNREIRRDELQAASFHCPLPLDEQGRKHRALKLDHVEE
jgi:hypothetical protein